MVAKKWGLENKSLWQRLNSFRYISLIPEKSGQINEPIGEHVFTGQKRVINSFKIFRVSSKIIKNHSIEIKKSLKNNLVDKIIVF